MPISQEANPTGTAESPFTTDISNLSAADVGRFQGLNKGEDGIHRARFEVTDPSSEFHGISREFTLRELHRQFRALEASGVNNDFANSQLGQLTIGIMGLEDLKLAGQFNPASKGHVSTPHAPTSIIQPSVHGPAI